MHGYMGVKGGIQEDIGVHGAMQGYLGMYRERYIRVYRVYRACMSKSSRIMYLRLR